MSGLHSEMKNRVVQIQQVVDGRAFHPFKSAITFQCALPTGQVFGAERAALASITEIRSHNNSSPK